MKKILSIITFLGLSISLFSSVPQAAACSCIMPEPPQVSFQKAKAVFAGRVIEMSGQVDGPMGFGGSSADNIKVTFDVSRAWKGITGSRVEILTAQSSASCGYNFEQGQEYLVYAYDLDGRLGTGLCSRNALLANANEDLAALGEGTAFYPLESRESQTHGEEKPLSSQFVVFGLAALGALVVVYLVSLRR